MKYYIAYKYTRNKNRDELKRKLEEVSSLLESRGHETFILGRDVKRWRHVHFGSIRLIPMIFKNMSKCDVLLAYVDSPYISKGLFFEAVIATLLGKKRIMYLKRDLKSKTLKFLFQEVKNISNIDEIK